MLRLETITDEYGLGGEHPASDDVLRRCLSEVLPACFGPDAPHTSMKELLEDHSRRFIDTTSRGEFMRIQSPRGPKGGMRNAEVRLYEDPNQHLPRLNVTVGTNEESMLGKELVFVSWQFSVLGSDHVYVHVVNSMDASIYPDGRVVMAPNSREFEQSQILQVSDTDFQDKLADLESKNGGRLSAISIANNVVTIGVLHKDESTECLSVPLILPYPLGPK